MSRTELAAIWPPTASAAREAGHEPMLPLKTIRTKFAWKGMPCIRVREPQSSLKDEMKDEIQF